MNGRETFEIDRTGHRYFVSDGHGERETDMDGFVAAERAAGFHPKPGCGPLATGGFSSGNREGRIEMPFEGPATVLDGDTGARTAAAGSDEAHDEARRLNAAEGRRRYWASPL